jgi:hypothetical protein
MYPALAQLMRSNYPVIWHPDRPDSLFFDQSAALHCFYYYTRILVHRPFIPGLSSMMEPVSLLFCVDAFR